MSAGGEMLMETTVGSPAHFLIKIESFSLFDNSEVDIYETKEFDAGNYKWRLIIYPNGHGTENPEEYVSVYLAISGIDSLPENWELDAVFSVFIVNQISGNHLHTPRKTRRFFTLKREWGFPNFISKKDLTTPSKGYMIDDSCLFGAEVFVNINSRLVTECLSLKKLKDPPYKHAFKISDFSKLKSSTTIWNSEEFTAGGYKWKVQLYPNGVGDEIGRSLSIYMRYVPSHDSVGRVNASYTICMKNQLYSVKNCKKSGSNWFEASNLGWGWRPFIAIVKLNDSNSGFIVNDTCLLEVEVSVQAVAQ